MGRGDGWWWDKGSGWRDRSVAGLLGGAALAQFLGSLLYEVKRVDALTFVSVGMLAIAVAALACYVPARRATSADPMTALRSDYRGNSKPLESGSQPTLKPSHRATTALARQLPSTLTEVRAISSSASTPSRTAKPSAGR